MVDFANSFVWGDGTIKFMDDPTGTGGADVTTGGSCAESGLSYSVKPSSTGIVDSDGDYTFGWSKIPLNSCGITPSQATNTDGKVYTYYDLYWNPQLRDSVASQNLYQLGQVKFRCRIDPYQEDSASITVIEDSYISNPNDKQVDLASGLQLDVLRYFNCHYSRIHYFFCGCSRNKL